MARASPGLNRLRYKDSYVVNSQGNEVKGTLPNFLRYAVPTLTDTILTGKIEHNAQPLQVRTRANCYGRR